MKNKTTFSKGHIPWNKGKKGIHYSPATEFKKGEHPSPKTEFKKGKCCGEKHLRWKGGRTKHGKDSYIKIYNPNHPRQCRNRVYEHIIVAEKKIGRYLNKNENVHHINGIKDDNRSSNLIVLTHKEHMTLHLKGRKREGSRGKWLPIAALAIVRK